MTTLIQRFNANQKGRDFIIGDLHGQWQLLQDAMAGVDFDSAVDRIFSVGDLIDRGEQSRECLELVREDYFFSVLGNHEQMMIDFSETQTFKDRILWQQNGGDAWTDPDFLESTEFAGLVRLAYTLPLAIEITMRDGRRVGITHAESPCKNWNEAEEKLEASWYRHKCLWNDSVESGTMWVGATQNIDLTVHGHISKPQAMRRDNACFIDSGAGYYDAPTAVRGKITDPRLSMIQLEDLFCLPQLSEIRAQQALAKRQLAIAAFSKMPEEDS